MQKTNAIGITNYYASNCNVNLRTSRRNLTGFIMFKRKC